MREKINWMFIFCILIVLSSTIAIAADSLSLSEWRSNGRTNTLNRYYPGPSSVANLSLVTAVNYTIPATISSPITILNGYAYFGTTTGNRLFQVNASNFSQHIVNISTSGTITYPPTIVNGYAYLASGSVLYQLNASNVSHNIANYTTSSTLSPPIIVNNSLYINSGVLLMQFNASNISQSISNKTEANSLSGAPSYFNNSVYIAISSTTFLVKQVNASNISQEIAQASTSGRFATSPVSIANGYAYECNTRFIQQMNASNISQIVNTYTFSPSTSINCFVAPVVAQGYVYFAPTGGPTGIYQVNESNVSQLIGAFSSGNMNEVSWIVATNNSVFSANNIGTVIQHDITNVSIVKGRFNTGTSAAVYGPEIVNGNLIFSRQSTTIHSIDLLSLGVSQLSPTAGYMLNNSENINFTCSASYASNLSNLSLYLTNNSNGNFVLNRTTSISGISNSSNWTIFLSRGNYTWNCLATTADNNISWGSNQSIVADEAAPTLNITAPLNNTNSSNTGLGVNYTVSDTYLQACWYSNDTMSFNYTLTCGANITGVTWSDGQHNLTMYANDTSGNLRSTSVRFTIDNVYPQFFNITDNNGTISSGGTAIFNVTVINTNGTVLLTINNTNYTAQNLSGNIFNVSVGLVNKTYNYTWVSYGNGPVRNSNRSSNQSYTVSGSADPVNPNSILIGPPNASLTASANVSFAANFTDNVQLSNFTLFVWNSTNSLISNITQNITGVSNVTNISIILPYLGTFRWNYRATDNSSNSAFNNTNYTIIYADSIYPLFTSFIDNNGTLMGSGIASFNITINNTNGTVIFSINNTNYSVQNLSYNTYNASVNLTNGTYTYYWASYGNGSSANYNVSGTRSYTIISGDFTAPTINISSPINNTNSTNNFLNINYSVNDTYLQSCWYSNDTMTINISLSGCSNITLVQWADGQHNVTIFTNDSSGNLNRSSIRFNIDASSPTWALNYTNLNSSFTGLAYFNITLNDSNPGRYIFGFYNGTAWSNDTNFAYINGNMVVANRTIDFTNTTVNWTWYVNDSFGNINQTSLFGIRLGGIIEEEQPIEEETRSNSIGSEAIYEVSGGRDDEIILKIYANRNSVISQDIRDSKGSRIKQFEIRTKNWITGEVTIKSYDTLPELCNIPDEEKKNLYKAIDFEHTFDNNDIESARVRIGIEKDWIKNHNVSSIKTVRCYPIYQELTTSYVDETDDEGIYDIYSNGFSIYAILGSEEVENVVLAAPKERSFGWVKWIFILIILAIIIALIIFLERRNAKLTEDFHIKNKWFDFEWKFKLNFRPLPHQRKSLGPW